MKQHHTAPSTCPAAKITTEEMAGLLRIVPQTPRAGLCRNGHYLGMRPVKLPNGKLCCGMPPKSLHCCPARRCRSWRPLPKPLTVPQCRRTFPPSLHISDTGLAARSLGGQTATSAVFFRPSVTWRPFLRARRVGYLRVCRNLLPVC